MFWCFKKKAKQLVISSTEKKMSSWVAKKIEEARDEIRQKEEEITKVTRLYERSE